MEPRVPKAGSFLEAVAEKERGRKSVVMMAHGATSLATHINIQSCGKEKVAGDGRPLGGYQKFVSFLCAFLLTRGKPRPRRDAEAEVGHRDRHGRREAEADAEGRRRHRRTEADSGTGGPRPTPVRENRGRLGRLTLTRELPWTPGEERQGMGERGGERKGDDGWDENSSVPSCEWESGVMEAEAEADRGGTRAEAEAGSPEPEQGVGAGPLEAELEPERGGPSELERSWSGCRSEAGHRSRHGRREPKRMQMPEADADASPTADAGKKRGRRAPGKPSRRRGRGREKLTGMSRSWSFPGHPKENRERWEPDSSWSQEKTRTTAGFFWPSLRRGRREQRDVETRPMRGEMRPM